MKYFSFFTYRSTKLKLRQFKNMKPQLHIIFNFENVYFIKNLAYIKVKLLKNTKFDSINPAVVAWR